MMISTSGSVEPLLCLLVEAFLPLELRCLGQQSTSSQGQGVYILLVNHRDDSEWCHSHLHALIPGCVNCSYGRKTAPWLEHRKPLGIQSPSPETLPPTWTCHLSFQKAILSIHCSRMAGKMVRPVNHTDVGRLQLIIGQVPSSEAILCGSA